MKRRRSNHDDNDDHSHMVKSHRKDVIKASTSSSNTTTTFSGYGNQGFQLGSNSGSVHVNVDGQSGNLSNVTQAAFNSFERQYEPLCLPDTRVDVLNEIRAWADGEDERRIYWLNGLAGTGKSTIARTIAREYFDTGRLGASFFFSKGGGDVGHARKFFSTIASQLAETSPSLKNFINDAVSKNKDIETKSLRDQWHHLILQPLLRLDGSTSPSSYILVIDALDECEGENDIRAILQLLANAQSLKLVQLRVFLTSRPETPIRHGFSQILDAEYRDFILHSILPSTINHDIHVFLEYNLNLIDKEYSLDTDWPDKQIIKRLTQKASGLFIWAATACRFIYDGKQFAAKRLAMILEGSIDSTTPLESQLNEIYVTVLKQSINPKFMEEEKKCLYLMMRQILGSIVVLFSTLSANSLCRLLHAIKRNVEQTLEGLHAILDIPKDQTLPLRLHHPSFRDFLVNKERCRDPNFRIDEKKAHQMLADSSIRLMTNSLKQDICSLDTYGVLVTDIDSIRVQQCLSQEVQYACLYWIQHLQKSDGRLYDNDQVHKFLQAHVLHWLEALSWMRKISEGIRAIICLESIALTSSCPSLYAFIHDMKRFALYFRAVIDQAPLQLYCSALIFAPMMSMVRKQFETQIPQWIKTLPEVEKEWNAVLQTLEGHSNSVIAIAFSPDSKVLASASYDQTVKLWHTDTGVALHTLEGHSDRVNAVAFSPDGKILALASTDKTVKLWHTDTGATLQTLEGHSNWVRAIAFSPNSKVLASASYDQTVKMWHTDTGVALHTLEGHSYRVNAVAFSPDGKILALASTDKTVKLWHTDTGATLQTLEGHSNVVRAVAFSPDGKVLASASDDGMVKLWHTDTGATLQTLEGHSDWVRAVAFSPDGKVLASASYDLTVKLWDVGTRAALQTLEGHSDFVRVNEFSPDSKVLASASDDGTVKLWHTDSGAMLQTLEGHSDVVNAVAFSPDGKVLASASDDRTVKLWDVGTGAALQTLEGHSDFVRVNEFSPDGKVLASASDDETVKLWHTDLGAMLQTLEGHSNVVRAVAFSPDGKVLASSSDDWTVKLWHTDSRAALMTLEGHLAQVDAVTFSPDGKVLASGSYDQTVKLWDSDTGATLQTLEGHSDWVRAVAFSPDGKVLASASDDRTVKLWDTDTGAALQTFKVRFTVETMSFTDDGTFLKTDGGLLRITFSPPGEAPWRNYSCEISVEEQWITLIGKNAILLPFEYRAFCSAVHGSVVTLGHKSGRVAILEFVL